MREDINKFFLHDRWFYFKKETANKRTYTTMIDDPNNGLILIIDKNTNEVEIISLKDQEFIAKLYVSDITKKDISFHYKESTPQNIYIEDDLYVNLLLEAFVETKYGRIDKQSVIRISKKKNLDKILYSIPPLPLDEDIYLDKYKIKSDMLDYFLGLIDSFSIYSKKLEQTNKQEAKQEEEPKDLEEGQISRLVIPQELQIYDRKYTFLKKDYGSVTYVNNQGEQSNIRVRIDPNFLNVLGMTLDFTNDKNQSFIFSALYNENNDVMVNFSSNNKIPIRLNYTDSINSHIVFEGTFDKKAKPQDVIIKLEKNSTLLTLTPHPIFSNVYVDQNGNEYRLGNQDLSKLMGMAWFSTYILDNLSKSLVKKK